MKSWMSFRIPRIPLTLGKTLFTLRHKIAGYTIKVPTRWTLKITTITKVYAGKRDDFVQSLLSFIREILCRRIGRNLNPQIRLKAKVNKSRYTPLHLKLR
jgi:hypothetical protein